MNTCYPIVYPEPAQGVSSEARSIMNAKRESLHNFIFSSVYTKVQIRSALNVQFLKLKSLWLEETKYLSNSDLIYRNNNYKKILEIGSEIIPILIDDLRKNEIDWFNALEVLTGSNPVLEEHRGIYDKMKNDWLNWAS
jgi:hypothetical protein